MASGGNAIRGSRVGAGPMGEQDHGFHADRIAVSYWDALGNETVRYFAADLPDEEIPETIDCPYSGLPGRARQGEPAAVGQDGAVQDAPRLREGAPHRRRGRAASRRGAAAAARAPRQSPRTDAPTLATMTAGPPHRLAQSRLRLRIARASVAGRDEILGHLGRRFLVDEEHRRSRPLTPAAGTSS